MKRHAGACCAGATAVLMAVGLGGCGQGASAPSTTVTRTVTAAPSVVVFNPVTSGKTLAARIVARAKAKNPAIKIDSATCANFPNIKVGTHTDCHFTVNGAKVSLRATFSGRTGHYVLARIKP